MIIDLILDRKDGKPYNAKSFYNSIIDYSQTFPEIAFPIAEALDNGNNADVKRQLNDYLYINGYKNKSIFDYVNSVDWLDL